LKIHPNGKRLEELLRSTGSGQQALIRHLVQCETCRDRLASLARTGSPAQLQSADYSAAFEAAAQSLRGQALALACERETALGLLAELTAAAPETRESLLRESRFRTWGLLELLVDRSWERSLDDPAAAAELAGLALRLADLLSPDRYRAELVEDLRARAWIYLGNARRLLSDLDGAEQALCNAAEHLGQGTGDPIERAVLLDREASLRRAQRRFAEALDCVTKAVGLFLRNGETSRAGRSLVNLSLIHSYAGETEESIAALSRALELIDPQEDPRTLLCARHNLAGYLAEAGRYREALRLFRGTRELYRSFPDAWTQNRRLWLQGRIDHGLGRAAAAESALRAARDGFLAEGIPYDTALVSLDLALLYAEQGRAAELKRLAGEMIPLFASHRIHREALAALSFLQQALEAERANRDLVTCVAGFLRKAQHDPELRWEGAEGAQGARGVALG
jgi:tetratricopeptide (TPR) repeat protein